MEDQKTLQLRLEIIESQKIQADYLKWKLISVATLVSISLGISGNDTNGEAEFLLCVVPFCCAYIDTVSLHVMMRIMTIGAYFKFRGCTYENYIDDARKTNKGSLRLENYALKGSSVIFNMLPIIFGVYKIIGFHDYSLGIALIAFGLLGIIFSCFLAKRFDSAVQNLAMKNLSP
ncbi:MAG: hypothetical protein D6B28_07790 [Gammaproteobacteria bacterium]|nr:MAG: hypothetical protein D6B28_07790 [Gammaproteobacteria bacterium]